MSTLSLNAAWMPVVLVLSTGVVSGSVNIALNSRESQENREFREYQRQWNSTIETRISNDKLETRETLVALKKDMESALKGVASIQQALMVRPSPSSLASQHTP